MKLPRSVLCSGSQSALLGFVPATWRDARETSFLFEGDSIGRWYPFTALRKVPRQFRREVLREFAEEILRRSHDAPRQRSQPRSTPPPLPETEVPTRVPQEDPAIAQARIVLGVSVEATTDEIKKAYRLLIKKYHPDVYARSQPELQHFAHEKARELNHAYQILASSEQK